MTTLSNSYYEKNITLGEALYYIQPQNYIVNSTDYSDEFETPVLTPGKSFILGYTNETHGIYDATIDNVIIFDDFTTATKFVDFRFKVKSSALKILASSNSNEYYIKYFYYLLSSIKTPVDTHKRFWISKYQSLIVSLPPIWYQILVADYLDVLFYKLQYIEDNKNSMVENLDIIRYRILDSFFGENSRYKSYYRYDERSLSDIATLITKGSTPTTYGFEYLSEGINFIKVENVKDFCVQHDTIKQFISEKAHEFQKRSQLEIDDLLISIAGTLGRICLIKDEDLPANTNQAFAIVRGYAQTLLPDYL